MESFSFKTRKDFQIFLEEEKDLVYRTIWKSIDHAAASGRKHADIAEVFLEEESVFIDMISEENEWVGSLTLAMNYYSSCKEYENCAQIKKLIEKIQRTTF